MADINEDTPTHQLAPTTALLEQFRRVPAGACVPTTLLQDYHQRKRQDPTIVAARRTEMVPEQMQLHTLGRDSLPLVGQAPVLKNLFFNTGHGHTPLATAVAGGMLAATAVSNANGKDVPVPSVLDPMDYSPARFTPQHYAVPWFKKRHELSSEDAKKMVMEAGTLPPKN
jgi:hypothetical protein